MLVLALDTATAATSVALVDVHTDGHTVLAEHSEDSANRHGEVLAPLIDRCLREAACARTDLELIGVGTGPGPFTGLRVGLMTARALGDALGIPVRGVCSLDVIAADHPGGVGVVTDARRREVYWARYDASGARTDGPGVERPAALAQRWHDDGFAGPVVGPGLAAYREIFADLGAGDERAVPRAGTLAVLAAGPDAGAPDPLYLRRPDARPFAERKPVTP